MFLHLSVILFTGGHAWQGGRVWWGACMAGGHACMAGEMAIAADGMHPTGMHSCLPLVYTPPNDHLMTHASLYLSLVDTCEAG